MPCQKSSSLLDEAKFGNGFGKVIPIDSVDDSDCSFVLVFIWMHSVDEEIAIGIDVHPVTSASGGNIMMRVIDSGVAPSQLFGVCKRCDKDGKQQDD